MTELDDKLQKLAHENWDEFVRIVGEDSLVVAKMRLLKEEGKSYNQVCIKLNVTQSMVRSAIKKLGRQNVAGKGNSADAA